ncbi:MAG: GNAT family N-acetyltransferase [Hyphomicrobium sp.]
MSDAEDRRAINVRGAVLSNGFAMSTTIDDRPTAHDAPRAGALRFAPRSDYIVEAFDGADEALAALEAVQGVVTSTAFQSLDWLIVAIEELAPAMAATPRVVVVTDKRSGEIAFALPLVITGTHVRTARFVELGVADCGAPLLGPAAPTNEWAMRSAWRAARAALRDVDVVRLEQMPQRIGARINPLLHCRGVAVARQSRGVITVETDLEAFLQSRGEEFCEGVAHGLRALQKPGGAKFYQATEPNDIARVFSAFDDQQPPVADAQDAKTAQRKALRAFYERMVIDGGEVGLSQVFALESSGEIIASLMGVIHDGVFTILRISERDLKASRVTAGLLIIVEVLHRLGVEGVRRFEFGVAGERYRKAFGAEAAPLYDVISAGRLRGAPMAFAHRTRSRLGGTSR